MSTKQWLIVGAVGALVVLGGAALTGWAWAGSQPRAAPQLVTARLGTLRQTVLVTGTIEPAQQANLSFGVGGQVTSVPATVGQQVQTGQTLATVNAASLPSQVAQARAAVAADEARLAADQTSGATDAQLNADNAAVTAANAQLAVAQQNLSKATLTAPFSGTVASVALTVGQQVSGNSSAGTNPTPAGVSGASGTSGGSGAASSATATSSTPNADVVVISTGTYVVDASVDDTEVGQLRSGEQAIIMPEGATRQVDGTVASVGMVGNQSSGVTTYPVTITVTGSPGDLPLGASAQISIIVRQLTGAVVVPRTAVHQNGAGSVVYEMAGGTQVSHPVTVGLSAGGQTQIISGLAAGTPVVVPAAPTGSSPSTTRRGNGAAGTGRGGGFSGGGFSGGGFSGGGFSGGRPGRQDGLSDGR